MTPPRARHTLSHRLSSVAILALLAWGGAVFADSPPAAPKPVAPKPVAEVDGKPITQAELDAAAAPHLAQLEAQKQNVLEGVLAQLVDVRLVEAEAAKRGITAEALVQAEVAAKVPSVSDEEVAKFYQDNQPRMGGRTLDELKDQIRQYLTQQRTEQAQQELVAALRKSHSVKLLMDVPRKKVEVADAAVKGAADAPVTIVEWSDFQCPFCSRVVPTLKQVQAKYGDQVRIAFRHYPLPNHPQAQKAAEASLCAREQGKFWEMHDALFANQSELGVDQLKTKAAGLGVDASQFNQCLDSGKFGPQIAADMAAGDQVGVPALGTPAIFVNGRALRGAVPFEEMASVIDDELSRQGKGK